MSGPRLRCAGQDLRTEGAWAVVRAREQIAKEAETRARLEAGELGVDLSGLRDKLIELGVEYID